MNFYNRPSGDWCLVGCLLTLLIAFSLLQGCSSVELMKRCKKISDPLDLYECRKP